MKDVKLPINVKVTYRTGAYDTAAVLRERASSTSDAETAIGRLVDKLTVRLQLQPGRLAAKPVAVKGLQAGVSMWQIDVAAFTAFGPEALKAAGYTTGHSGAPGVPRCARCANCGPVPAGRCGLSKNDRQCSRFGTKVKTHGCCPRFSEADAADAADDDAGDESIHHHSRGGDLS